MRIIQLFLRWWPIVSVAAFFLTGLVVGFFYQIEAPTGHQLSLQFLQKQSHSTVFDVLACASVLWYALAVAVVGRSTWPISTARTIFIYAPMSFAFGFAARFFVLVFGFSLTAASVPGVSAVAQVALVVFVYLCVVVGLPTYATFSGSFIKDEALFRKLSILAALVMGATLWAAYA